MKHEWRKAEKAIYLPKDKPEFIDLKAIKYFTIEGSGNPNDEAFIECIETLYARSYKIRMMLKTVLRFRVS